ncbi:hypothetical protein QX213_21975 [Vibrio vulnificus]|nr:MULTISPECIES: hypothetical protein [Vibrio]MBE3884756.1 hypothetical protein [Vibrio parahaemolyticus]MBE4236539.1 hypothetical protein [Vibrio parahaemolyticus]MBE4282268.1 hypothetical protein [Vibrio parahaemolyticus]MBE4530866.1 hypothetical protein [Vibrio parahaemolyticus]MCI9706908.1 hypothetical protein [Vibrio parahaemolyticus]
MTEEKRIEDKVKRSEKISELTLYVAFGLVALTYTLFSSKSDFAKLLLEHKSLFLIASICGVVSILLHYLQYVAGYFAAQKALAESDFQYSRKWWSYRMIKPFFVAKQIVVIAGVIVVGTAMTLTLVA